LAQSASFGPRRYPHSHRATAATPRALEKDALQPFTVIQGHRS